MIKIEVKGYKEAYAIMQKLSEEMHKKILLSALKSSCKPLLKSARNFVPKRTKTLGETLKIQKLRYGLSPTEVSVAVKHVFANYKKGKVNEFYGLFVHEGTQDPRTSRNKKKVLKFYDSEGKVYFRKKVKGMPGNPYLEKAYAGEEQTTMRIFGDELAKSVQRFINRNKIPIK